VHELPYFNDLYKEHGDDIAMLAVHSSIVTDDPAEFLKDKGWEIPFVVDTDDDQLWKIVNGSSTLPQTIVLDKDVIVVYNQKESVTPEMLEALYEQAEQGYYKNTNTSSTKISMCRGSMSDITYRKSRSN
jgi:hypothetical protein